MTLEQPNDVVTRARKLCISAHAGQTRDSGEPYSTHPIAVADILRQFGMHDADVLAAAYLHDVLEDTTVTMGELTRQFGRVIAGIVEELTDHSYPGRTRKVKQLQLLTKPRQMSPAAKMIKLADRLHNLSEMAEVWDGERCKRYAGETVELLRALRPWPAEAIAIRIAEVANAWLFPEHPPGMYDSPAMLPVVGEPIQSHEFHCHRSGEIAGRVTLYQVDQRHCLLGAGGYRAHVESWLNMTIPVDSNIADIIARALQEGNAAALYGWHPQSVPFYCPKCDASYARALWKLEDVFEPGWGFDYQCGECPVGHSRITMD